MSSAAQRQNYTFFHSLRVRWAEVDPQGIVFNGNYLTYQTSPPPSTTASSACPTRPTCCAAEATCSR